MKKISTLIMTLVIAMSLAGCGGEETSSTPKNEVPADQLAQQQALADEDYDQLSLLLQGVTDHYALSDQTSAVREQVINGQAEESALLESTKEMADHAQSLLEQVQKAQWKTEY